MDDVIKEWWQNFGYRGRRGNVGQGIRYQQAYITYYTAEIHSYTS